MVYMRVEEEVCRPVRKWRSASCGFGSQLKEKCDLTVVINVAAALRLQASAQLCSQQSLCGVSPACSVNGHCELGPTLRLSMHVF